VTVTTVTPDTGWEVQGGINDVPLGWGTVASDPCSMGTKHWNGGHWICAQTIVVPSLTMETAEFALSGAFVLFFALLAWYYGPKGIGGKARAIRD